MLPVKVSIVESRTNGIVNPPDPVARYNYEHPYIGTGMKGADYGLACTNIQPTAMDITLNVQVSGVVIGGEYVLYEYIIDSIVGGGTHTILNVPLQDFNANAASASSVTKFTASSSTFMAQYERSSMIVLVYRAVSILAP